LAEAVAARLDAAQLISMDWYYRDLTGMSISEKDAHNFDHPSAINHEMLRSHLEKLLNGESIETPRYDFATHSRLPETVSTTPEAHLIVEGLHALWWREIRSLAHTKVFVTLDCGLRLSRRIARDVKVRGRRKAAVRDQFEQNVRPMHEAYVEPTRGFADLLIQGDGNVDRLSETIASFHLSHFPA
jgi:uridine kinase